MKLNQVIALVGGRKTRIHKLMTEIHHGWKADRLAGICRTYQSKDEDGEVFPSENHPVQVKANVEIDKLIPPLIDFYDLVYTQESSNASATGDIVVDSIILVKDVPVTVLLFLEKQFVDLLSLCKKIPTLTYDKVWKIDNAKSCYVTEPEQTVKTQKVPEPLVKYPATKEHPAQVDVVNIDRTIGHWTTIHMSGALPEAERLIIEQRIMKLIDAVKSAREQANSIDITMDGCGEALLCYVFGK